MVVVVLGAFFAVAAAIAAYAIFFSEAARIKRRLRATADVPIGQFGDGMVGKITGAVELLGEPARAPLSGRECAYYTVQVEEKRTSGKSHYWRTIISDHSGRDFLVRDGTGVALVRYVAPKAAVVKDAHFRSGFLNDATPELEAFLAKHGFSSEGFLFNRTLRYHEGVIEAGEQVAVLGKGRWEDDPEGEPQGYRDRTRRLVMDAPDDEPLHLSDDPSTLG